MDCFPFGLSLFKLFFQSFLIGKVGLVFCCVDVGAFRQGNFHQRVFLLFAKDDANGWLFVVKFYIAVKVVYLHLHLANILVL